VSKVLTPCDVRAIDGDRWLLLAPYRCVSDRLGVIEIEPGFITDFNSTPKIFWNILPPTEFLEASLPHDFLYNRGELAGVKVSREDADAVHQEFVAWAGGSDDPAAKLADDPRQPAPAWKRTAFHSGLRLFGWVAWNRYRRAGDGVRTTRPIR
jgi:hypothetical protein